MRRNYKSPFGNTSNLGENCLIMNQRKTFSKSTSIPFLNLKLPGKTDNVSSFFTSTRGLISSFVVIKRGFVFLHNLIKVLTTPSQSKATSNFIRSLYLIRNCKCFINSAYRTELNIFTENGTISYFKKIFKFSVFFHPIFLFIPVPIPKKAGLLTERRC